MSYFSCGSDGNEESLKKTTDNEEGIDKLLVSLCIHIVAAGRGCCGDVKWNCAESWVKEHSTHFAIYSEQSSQVIHTVASCVSNRFEISLFKALWKYRSSYPTPSSVPLYQHFVNSWCSRNGFDSFDNICYNAPMTSCVYEIRGAEGCGKKTFCRSIARTAPWRFSSMRNTAGSNEKWEIDKSENRTFEIAHLSKRYNLKSSSLRNPSPFLTSTVKIVKILPHLETQCSIQNNYELSRLKSSSSEESFWRSFLKFMSDLHMKMSKTIEDLNCLLKEDDSLELVLIVATLEARQRATFAYQCLDYFIANIALVRNIINSFCADAKCCKSNCGCCAEVTELTECSSRVSSDGVLTRPDFGNDLSDKQQIFVEALKCLVWGGGCTFVDLSDGDYFLKAVQKGDVGSKVSKYGELDKDKLLLSTSNSVVFLIKSFIHLWAAECLPVILFIRTDTEVESFAPNIFCKLDIENYLHPLNSSTILCKSIRLDTCLTEDERFTVLKNMTHSGRSIGSSSQAGDGCQISDNSILGLKINERTLKCVVESTIGFMPSDLHLLTNLAATEAMHQIFKPSMECADSLRSQCQDDELVRSTEISNMNVGNLDLTAADFARALRLYSPSAERIVKEKCQLIKYKSSVLSSNIDNSANKADESFEPRSTDLCPIKIVNKCLDSVRQDDNSSDRGLNVVVPVEGFETVVGEDFLIDQLTESILKPFVSRCKGFDNPTEYDCCPTGLVLEGITGSGKTHLVKALAHECGISMLVVYASDILTAEIGVTERNLMNVFHCAQNSSPAILLIENAEILFPERPKGKSDVLQMTETDRRKSAVFLNCIDEIRQRQELDVSSAPLLLVLTVAVTDLLDQRILQKHRLRHIYCTAQSKGQWNEDIIRQFMKLYLTGRWAPDDKTSTTTDCELQNSVEEDLKHIASVIVEKLSRIAKYSLSDSQDFNAARLAKCGVSAALMAICRQASVTALHHRIEKENSQDDKSEMRQFHLRDKNLIRTKDILKAISDTL